VTPAGVVTTLAGLAGIQGSADGNGSDARFNLPGGVAVDGAGNVYVADSANSTIRHISPSGTVTTLAGLAENPGKLDGTGSEARFWGPNDVARDVAGNLYVTDSGNNLIRKISPGGVVTTLAGNADAGPGSADGTGNDARFRGPDGVAVDNNGNVYVADTFNHTIRKVTPAGVVTTLAGLAGAYGSTDGTNDQARFYFPNDLTIDAAGDLIVADTRSNTIRKVTPEGVVTTLAGRASSEGYAEGPGTVARFKGTDGIAVDGNGIVYVADGYNHSLRKITPAGFVSTLAGLVENPGSNDGTGSQARFQSPLGIAVDVAGDLYVGDTGNHTIRKVTSAGVVTTLAGLAGAPGKTDGIGSAARFLTPIGVVVSPDGWIYVADNGNHTIRRIAPDGDVITLSGVAGWWGSADGSGTAARFFQPRGLALDVSGNLFVADTRNHLIRRVTPVGDVTTFAGSLVSDPVQGPLGGSADGTGSAARFNWPTGIAADAGGNLFVTDGFHNTIRKVTPLGVVTTLAGVVQFDAYGNGVSGSTDGTGSAARFRAPSGIAAGGDGSLYVVDAENCSIRKGHAATVIQSAGPGFGFNNGRFGFSLVGPAGQPVVVEASADLVNWQPVWTNTFVGELSFSDLGSGTESTRFYRTRAP